MVSSKLLPEAGRWPGRTVEPLTAKPQVTFPARTTAERILLLYRLNLTCMENSAVLALTLTSPECQTVTWMTGNFRVRDLDVFLGGFVEASAAAISKTMASCDIYVPGGHL